MATETQQATLPGLPPSETLVGMTYFVDEFSNMSSRIMFENEKTKPALNVMDKLMRAHTAFAKALNEICESKAAHSLCQPYDAEATSSSTSSSFGSHLFGGGGIGGGTSAARSATSVSRAGSVSRVDNEGPSSPRDERVESAQGKGSALKEQRNQASSAEDIRSTDNAAEQSGDDRPSSPVSPKSAASAASSNASCANTDAAHHIWENLFLALKKMADRHRQAVTDLKQGMYAKLSAIASHENSEQTSRLNRCKKTLAALRASQEKLVNEEQKLIKLCRETDEEVALTAAAYIPVSSSHAQLMIHTSASEATKINSVGASSYSAHTPIRHENKSSNTPHITSGSSTQDSRGSSSPTATEPEATAPTSQQPPSTKRQQQHQHSQQARTKVHLGMLARQQSPAVRDALKAKQRHIHAFAEAFQAFCKQYNNVFGNDLPDLLDTILTAETRRSLTVRAALQLTVTAIRSTFAEDELRHVERTLQTHQDTNSGACCFDFAFPPPPSLQAVLDTAINTDISALSSLRQFEFAGRAASLLVDKDDGSDCLSVTGSTSSSSSLDALEACKKQAAT